jgi:hypothetical protein
MTGKLIAPGRAGMDDQIAIGAAGDLHPISALRAGAWLMNAPMKKVHGYGFSLTPETHWTLPSLPHLPTADAHKRLGRRSPAPARDVARRLPSGKLLGGCWA